MTASETERRKGEGRRMTGAQLITQERRRQQKKDGWTAEHDSGHEYEELAWAAVCYAAPSTVTAEKITLIRQWGCNCRSVDECYCSDHPKECENVRDPWPWDDDEDKRGQHSRLRQLVIAGALIAAEIDRLQAEDNPKQTAK